MNKLLSFYRRNRIEILFITNIVFIGLAIAAIILHLISLDKVRIERWLVYTIPLVSPVVLFLAFRESVKANRIQTSAHFYEDLVRRIEAAEINEEINTRQFLSFNNFIGLEKRLPRTISIKDFPDYLNNISKSLKKSNVNFEEIFRNWKSNKDDIEKINNFLNFYDKTYLPTIFKLAPIKKEIDDLHKEYYLVKHHKILLYNKLYLYLQGFLFFSKVLLVKKPIYNPTTHMKVRGRYRDFFDIVRVKLFRDVFNDIIPELDKL